MEEQTTFARAVAVKAASDLPIEIDDAIQVGFEALVVSAQRFDIAAHDESLGTLETHFKSFAYRRIYGSVIDLARKNTFVKRRGIERGMKVQMVSLDAVIEFDDHDSAAFEVAAISGDPDLVLDFEQAMNGLSDRERYVVIGLASGIKGRELADKLGITESRVSQLNTQAKAKLLDYMEVAA